MKRLLFFSLLFLRIIYSQNFYNDKIISIKIENTSDIESKLNEIKNLDFDAVVIKSFLSNEILKESKFNSEIFRSVENKLLGKQIYFEIDFSNSNFSQQNFTTIKQNIKSFVDGINFRGFLFSNINLNDEAQYSMFENIIVESAIIKPYLHTLIDSKSFAKNDFNDKLLSSGIIDFIFDNDKLQRNENFSDDFVLKTYLKKLSVDNFYKLNLSEIVNNNENFVLLLNNNSQKIIDKNFCVNFILTDNPDSIKIKTNDSQLILSKADWVIPYNYKIKNDGSILRYDNWVEFRRQFARKTYNNIYNLLCKTFYPSKVKINDEEVKIYKTGIFFKKIKLIEGLNKLKAEAIDKNGNHSFYEDEVLFLPKQEEKIQQLSIDESSISPNENLILTKNDFITFSFIGSKNQKGFVEVLPLNKTYNCQTKDLSKSSQYSVQIPLDEFPQNEKLSFKLVLQSSTNENERVYKTLNNTLIIKNENDFPLLITKNDYSLLEFTLAPIRLGAPLRNELPKNVTLKSNGIFGDYYRIKLNDTEEGYINKQFVDHLPNGTPQPTYFINPISAFPDSSCDVVRIPYLENVPYDIYSDPFQKRIIISLYGVKTSSTWIIHKPNLRYIEEITWQQTSKETYKIYVNLNTEKIWGIELKPNGKELLLKIKYPPSFNLKSKQPLKGVKISIEAGHGGSNIGAVGLSGMKEKDLNLDLSRKLEALLKKYGADVFMVRTSDKDMTLLEKRTLAINSGANIHFSIHANSSEPIDEYLGTNGTCTFYNNPYWAPLAEKVFHKLIELKLAPFGSVGSFNYRVSRINEMPSILIEQAFMSHAEDEEKLADDNFRNQMAQKIYEGLIEYLKYMSSK